MDHFDEISPLLKVSHWIGLAPFYVHINPQSQKKELYLSSHNYIITIIVLGVLIVTPFAKFYFIEWSEFECFWLTFLKYLTYYESWGSLLLVCVIYVVSFIKRPKLMEITTSVEELDSTLSSMNVDIPYKHNQKWITILIFSFGTLDLMMVIINDWELFAGITELIDLLPSLLISVYHCWFISIMIVFKYRLKVMNEILTRTCDNYYISTDEQRSVKDQQIDVVTKLHDKLCNIVDMVNDCYGFMIMIVLAYWYFYVIFLCYLTFKWGKMWVLDGEEYFMFYFFRLIYITLVEIFRVAVIVLSTSLVTNQFAKTLTFVHQTINCFSIENLQNKLTIFLMQLINRKPTFTACGLFEINLPLLFSMVGALFTYVIILIQFDQSDQGCIEKHVETKINGTVDYQHENLTRAIYEILNDVRNNFTTTVTPAAKDVYSYVALNVTDPSMTALSNITNTTLSSLTQSNMTAPLAAAFSALSELITEKMKNVSDVESLTNITSEIRGLLSRN